MKIFKVLSGQFNIGFLVDVLYIFIVFIMSWIVHLIDFFICGNNNLFYSLFSANSAYFREAFSLIHATQNLHPQRLLYSP